ncbi:MAG TPA: hypothetical protein VKR61_21730 [Bryobacteraceae bacterium]|nr:hypothetical protein [Bryobacteraceae bacterium]
MKLILALLAAGLSLQAQPWDALRALGAGDRIKVTDNAHREYQGTFQASSDRAISLETRKGPVEIERARVRRVELRSSSRRLRNVVIGVGIGVAVGVAVDQTLGTFLRNETGDDKRALMYVAPIGLFGGIGAALPAYRTIYRAR